ncbi:hypothetical protein ANTQUA_LOCUS9594 [Anthophora quadrimaculata]
MTRKENYIYINTVLLNILLSYLIYLIHLNFMFTSLILWILMSNHTIFVLKLMLSESNNSELSLTDAAKEARFSLKASRKENEEEYLNMEGQVYGPGIAD